MKKTTNLVATLLLVGSFLFSSCKKNHFDDAAIYLTSPKIGADLKINGMQTRVFKNKLEYDQFLSNISKLQFVPMKFSIKKIATDANGATTVLDDPEANPCPNDNPAGDAGAHVGSGGVEQAPVMQQLTGTDLGFGTSFLYHSTGNSIQVDNVTSLITGTNSAPNSQTSTGSYSVNGTNINMVGSITANWVSGTSSTVTVSNTYSNNTTAGISFNGGLIAGSTGASGNYTSTLTNTLTNTGTNTSSHVLSYELSVNICDQVGSLKLKLDGNILYNGPISI